MRHLIAEHTLDLDQANESTLQEFAQRVANQLKIYDGQVLSLVRTAQPAGPLNLETCSGLIGCWKVDLPHMGPDSVPLIYQAAEPLPGHNLDVMIDDRCARSFCLPKESKVTAKVDHSTFVMLIDKRGYERVGFPASDLTPEGLAHDIRELERERV